MSTPISIVLSNNNYADFIGVVYHYLLSVKAKEALSLERVSGYSISESLKLLPIKDLSQEQIARLQDNGYKVEKFSDHPPCYFRMSVSVGCKLHSKSEITLVKECNVCAYKKYASKGKTYVDPMRPIYLRANTWNGKDLFRVEELGAMIFCTENFYQAYQKYKLLGLVFSPTEAI